MKSPRRRINLRVLNDLKTRSTIGIPFYILLAALVLITDDFYLQYPHFSLLFFVAVIAICAVRFIHVFTFQQITDWHADINRMVFISTILLTALIWGAGFAVVVTCETDFYAKSLMAICTAGLCAGGVVAFLPNRPLAFMFNALIMLPSSFILLFERDNLSLATMIFLYFIYMLIITFRGHEEYWMALENEIKLEKQSETLRNISRIDVLTGLYNRRYFDEVFESEWKRASREGGVCTLVLGDIDHFKQVNDTYGHLAGDAYLKKLADILTSVFKRSTDMVARYGGEEFVILLPDTNTMQAYEMAEKVRSKVESTEVNYNFNTIQTTVSFGIASAVPDYKISNQTLISQVDKALYRAKQEGRNRIVIANQ